MKSINPSRRRIVAAASLASLSALAPHLASAQAWPQNTHLRVVGLQDGRLIVPKGEAFTLRVVNGENSIAPESVLEFLDRSHPVRGSIGRPCQLLLSHHLSEEKKL